MLRLAGLVSWGGLLVVVLTSGCHHKGQTVYVVQASAAAPAPAVEEPAPAPAPVVEAAPVEPPPAQAPAPVVVAPAPVVVAPAPVAAVSVSVFHTHLGHHGRWMTVASYGEVWVPAGVSPGWQPYTVGHWVLTDAYGWMWVSDEPWGWATYHYGRWVFVEPQGWVWVPGTVWGPAWVVWRSGGGYVGWAPMPPTVVVAEPRPSMEVNINIGVNVVEHIHPSHWTFVREAYVLEPVHRHMVSVTNNITIIRQTHNVTNIVESHGRIVNRSISTRDVERVTGRPVRALRVREVESDSPSRTAVQRDEVVIERPRGRVAATDVQTGAKPRVTDNTQVRTRTPPPAQPKVNAPTLPSTGQTSGDRNKRSGQAVQTDSVHQSGSPIRTDTNVRDQVRRGDNTPQSTVTSKQLPRQDIHTETKGNTSASTPDIYQQPSSAKTPKVDPAAGRKPKPAPKPAEVKPQIPTDSPSTDAARRSSASRQQKTDQVVDVRDDRARRGASTPPVVEGQAGKTVTVAPNGQGISDKQDQGEKSRDRSRAASRATSGDRAHRGDTEQEKDNNHSQRD